jgi:hypothetical protein
LLTNIVELTTRTRTERKEEEKEIEMGWTERKKNGI